jgi:hypothetical protein
LAQHHRSDDILVFGIILLVVSFVLPFLGLPGVSLVSYLGVAGLAVLIILAGLLGRKTGRKIYGE